MATEFPQFTSLTGGDERKDWTELRRANYAAADVLFQRAQGRLNPQNKVQLVQLVNLGEPLGNGTPALMWLVPQQVGNRLAQLGLNVQQPDKAPLNSADKRATGALPLQLVNNASVLPAGQVRKPGMVYLEGDYAYMDDELLISLRLIDGRDNRILSTAEYDLAVDADVLTLIDPASSDRIFGTGWMH